MNKMNLYQSFVRRTSMLLIILGSFFMHPSLKAQTTTNTSNDRDAAGTPNSRLAATIAETDSTITMEVFVVGELRADALDFNFFYNPEVLILTDKTFAQQITAIGRAVANPVLYDALAIEPELLSKKFEFGTVWHKEKGSSGFRSNYSFNANMRALNISMVQNQPTPQNIITAKKGEIVPVFKCYFRKLSKGTSLQATDFGIGVKTSIAGGQFSPKWAYRGTVVSYADNTSSRTGISENQFLYRSPSSTQTEKADKITANTATFTGTFKRGNFSPLNDLANGTGKDAAGKGRLDCDSVLQYGFIYSTANTTINVKEFTDTIIIDGVYYPFPTAAEMEAGTFVRGENTFGITTTTNSKQLQLQTYSFDVTGLARKTTYSVWSYITYKFQTSTNYPLVAEKQIFTTSNVCEIAKPQIIADKNVELNRNSTNITLVATSTGKNYSGNEKYTWSKDGLQLTGSQNTITINTAGNYTVAVTDGGCVSDSANITIAQDGNNALSISSGEENAAKGYSIYPNPAKENIYFSNNFSGHITIYSTLGAKMYAKTISPNEPVSVKSLPSGNYIVEMKGSFGTIRRNLIVE